ncbi:hypothetical protein NW762_002894 [Fusarium torreyae]|uniref:Uncharacterized protein n=1 Tax=Fusarium torreyae TaxID=1237075 RepID=A0A9W8SBG5_9HYPO|nr:hypothetical protein NW762_002894 [Fusarium torreyae]
MNLQDLLPELIIQICELLCQHCAEDHIKWPRHEWWPDESEPRILRHALLNLSLLCKSWGAIAQKVLHHNFGFLDQDPVAQVLFCRTISENPELAKQLKHAKLYHIETAFDKALAQSWITDVLKKFSTFLTLDTETSRWEEFIAPLILLQVPNLKHLVAEGTGDWMLFEKFNIQAVIREHALPRHIQALNIGKIFSKHDETLYPVGLSNHGFAGILPAFDDLRHIAIWHPGREPIQHPLAFQNIRTLCFGNASLSRRQLHSLVSATGPLEDFVYGGRTYHPDAVSGEEVFEILALRKDTLKAAKVVTHKTTKCFAAASQLTNLEILTLEYDTFWQPSPGNTQLDDQALVGAFPASLEGIQISVFHEHLEGMREALINYILSTCAESREEQKLKSVILFIYGKAEDPQTPDADSLDAIVKYHGGFSKKTCQKFLKNKGRIRLISEIRHLTAI